MNDMIDVLTLGPQLVKKQAAWRPQWLKRQVQQSIHGAAGMAPDFKADVGLMPRILGGNKFVDKRIELSQQQWQARMEEAAKRSQQVAEEAAASGGGGGGGGGGRLGGFLLGTGLAVPVGAGAYHYGKREESANQRARTLGSFGAGVATGVAAPRMLSSAQNLLGRANSALNPQGSAY